ncbi:hypothetical protein [Mesomycoplasma neurolyticum]|uniref:Polymerase nucleotidyl transferase domain-containing protein n=1 Tax=Mesomycoplasma neurolyticum TaxID=2120 RepID=A0A449A5Y3_9BACT|nr:hypothetical protein [Mesomycoplasma neurolyticum]VEU59632.1 Uncharacterised protein [Mesomycoplasma neurolyticum]
MKKINELIKLIKTQYKCFNIIIKKHGSSKYKINYNITNSPRLSSDDDIMIIFDLKNLDYKDLKIAIHKIINNIFLLAKVMCEKELYKVKLFPSLLRITTKEKIFDLSFCFLKNNNYFTFDNMNSKVVKVDLFTFENEIKKFIKKTKYGKHTLKFIKTFMACYRIYQHRLPKGQLLTILTLKLYNEQKNLESTIFYTLKNIFEYVKQNFLFFTDSSPEKFIYYKKIKIKIKFDKLAFESFIKILNSFLTLEKSLKLYLK